MTTYTSLDEANKRIAELEEKLAHALEVGGARGRLLAEAEAERNLLREQTRGRGEIIEALTRECASTRAFARDVVQEALAICRLAGAILPANVVSCAKAAGFDV